MNMVRDTTDPITLASGATDGSSHVGVQRLTDGFVQKWISFFRAEYHVNKQQR